MTDLLRRLAARAYGPTRYPSTRPLLPSRSALERIPFDRPKSSGREDTADGAPDESAAPAQGTGSHDRETGKRRQEERTVTVTPMPPAPLVRPARGAVPAVTPPADPVAPRKARHDIDVSFERQSTTRHHGTPAAVPRATAPAPPRVEPAARPSAGPVGVTPSASVEPGPRPDRRSLAPRRETTQPTIRRREPLQVPVVVPLPGPVPVPLTLASRAVESSALTVAEDAGPVVTISIGRVEIRAVPPAGPAVGAREPTGSSGAGAAETPSLSLGEFLRGAGGAR
ncbi:hypothetical protein [Streptomyces zaomyceticus]|uniref:hypothetical protein n=1 Tax=Streptomyces zaomyceticus TaxID=68286 RepID=UPI00167AB2B6|nr:hypothetical protein [Streptomyces zaomyceticus]GHG00575.1 hypothetical protein GCM10018791_09940 [Streptomyces zaomyceticus]